MQVEVVLTYQDENGTWREAVVTSRRFTIGSSAGNDLSLDAAGVAHRHVVIVTHEGGVFVYDCQSPQGTLLNNAPLRGSAPLHGGDRLTLGGSYEITVKMPASRASHTRAVQPTHAAPRASLPPARNTGGGSAPTFKHVAVVAALLLLVLIGFFVLADRRPAQVGVGGKDGRRTDPPPVEADSKKPSAADAPAALADAAAAGDQELEGAAIRAVQRVSGDHHTYPFPPEVLRDIGRQVEQYRQSHSLRDAFVVMQRESRSVAAQARAASVPPGMVIYAALAESDGGRDPSATARRMVTQLHDLRVPFGGDRADDALLVLAAYPYGVGSKKSHPLLATIRKLVRNPYVERNVWYLREHGGLSDAAYGFVIRTLAIGVIAQDPRRYGMQAGQMVY